MSWKPGMPVLTPRDEVEWRDWRYRRALERQRERRASLPRRVDYYPSPEAAVILRRFHGPRVGQDNSSIINTALEQYVRGGMHAIPD